MPPSQKNIALKTRIKANQHEIYVISIDEMDAIVKSLPKGNISSTKEVWKELKGKLEFGANYTASGSDIRTLGKLVADLGSFTTKAYIKSYGGKVHIILKGYPGSVLAGVVPAMRQMVAGRMGEINGLELIS